MSMRGFLEKFVALPIGVFRNRMDKVEKRIQKLDAKLDKEKLRHEKFRQRYLKEQQKQSAHNERQTKYNQQQIQHQAKQLQYQEQQVRHNKQQQEQAEAILTVLNSIDKKQYYKVGYEAGAIKSFHDAYSKPEYADRFLRLTKGLDKDEVAKLVCILERQRKIKDSKWGDYIDLYTPEEQASIKHMAKYCESHTYAINDNLFCFDGHLLPKKHFELSVFYFKHGIYDLTESSRESVKGTSIIDVGGFYGDSVLVLEELQPKSVYTFEAVGENYDILQDVMKLNNIDNCIAEKVALGDEEGEIKFYVRDSTSNMQTVDYIENFEGEEVVPITTLDKYMETHDVEKVGLIKVDIEGAEQSFLRGAKDTIAKHKPILLMSIYHNADDFFDIKPMIESWNLGYKFKIHKPCDFTISREVLLICEP